jgi:hypothetical protein
MIPPCTQAAFEMHLPKPLALIAHGYLIPHKRGANDWDGGLFNACNSGHLEIVKLMIAHGATDLNDGLNVACRHNYREIINLLIANGATQCECGTPIHEHVKKYK